MSIISNIKNLYYNNSQLTYKEYEKSRRFFIFEGITSSLIFNLTSGAFLAGLMKYIGANDELIGITAAIPTLAATVQLFSPVVMERMHHRKLLISFMCLFHRLLLGLMIFIPLLFKDTSVRLSLLISAYLLSYLSVNFISPAASNWIISLVPSHMRGEYFGRKDSYILTFITIINLIMGWVLDFFRGQGIEYLGFLIVYVTVIVLAILNFSLLSCIREPQAVAGGTPSLRKILTLPLKDSAFKKVIILFMLWNIGLQVGFPFFSVYMVTKLKLTYTYIMFLSMLSSITSVLIVRYWGRVADKKTWPYTTKVCIGMLALTSALWFFVNSQTALILLPVLNILGGAAWAGINISLFNIQFQYSPEEGRTIYIGFNSALGGLTGFISALISSFIVGRLNNRIFNVLGFSITNMQIVFGLSGIILGLCAAYVHFFIQKKEYKVEIG